MDNFFFFRIRVQDSLHLLQFRQSFGGKDFHGYGDH